MRMLTAVPAHRRRRRGHEDRSFASRFHQRAHGRCEAKETERPQTPACLESLERRVLQRPIADLGAQVVDDDFDRADLGLDGGNPLFDGVCLDGVEEKSGCRTAVALDRVHQSIQSVRVAAPTQTGVIALLGEASSDSSTDARTGTDHQTNGFHVRSLLSRAVDLFESQRPPAEWAQICGALSGASRRRRLYIGVSREPHWQLRARPQRRRSAPCCSYCGRRWRAC